MSLALLAEYTAGPFESLNATIFFTMVVLAFVLHMGRCVTLVSRYWIVLPWPFFMLASVMWSDAPDMTFRFGSEFVVTVLGGILIGAVLGGWTVARVLMTATGALVVGSLAYVPLAMARHVPLIGPFGSKNIEAFISHALFTVCVAIIFGGKQQGPWRLAALILAPISVFTLALAQSAGATVSMGISTGVLIAGGLYMLVPKRFRLLVIVTAVIAGLMIIPLYPEFKQWWKEFQQDVLHKDETLTGRTYLWDFAKGLIAERPLLGHGAGSFWRVGNIDAEGLWTRYKIFNQYGFNFHNSFIEFTVSTGYVGIATFIVVLVWVACRIVFSFLREPNTVRLWLLAYFTAWYARLGTEDLIGAFDPQTTLLVTAGVVVAHHARKTRKRPQPRWRPPPVPALELPAAAPGLPTASPGE